MAPGGQTRCGVLCLESLRPLVVVYQWLQRTLSIRFCYHNSFEAVARALGLSTIPVCVICGIVSLPFGGFNTFQGVVALIAAILLLMLEKPLARSLLKGAREHPMKRAFIYMTSGLLLLLSWQTLLAGLGLECVAGCYCYKKYAEIDEEPILPITTEKQETTKKPRKTTIGPWKQKQLTKVTTVQH